MRERLTSLENLTSAARLSESCIATFEDVKRLEVRFEHLERVCSDLRGGRNNLSDYPTKIDQRLNNVEKRAYDLGLQYTA